MRFLSQVIIQSIVFVIQPCLSHKDDCSCIFQTNTVYSTMPDWLFWLRPRPWHSQLSPFSFRCCCLMVLDCSAAMDGDEGKMSGRIMFIRTWATKFVRPNIVKTLKSAPSTVGGTVVQWTCDHRGCGFKSRFGHGCLTTRGKLRPITKQ